MSAAAAAPPLSAVPSFEATKAGMASSLAGKAAKATNWFAGLFANLGKKFLSLADKVHVGGPVRWVASATRWVIDKLAFVAKPFQVAGPVNVVGLMLTTRRGQRLFNRLLIIGMWPARATWRTTVRRLPGMAMGWFGDRGKALKIRWLTRVASIEQRAAIYYKFVKEHGLRPVFSADKVWIRIASRYFTWRIVFNVARRFVPWAPLRWLLNGLYLAGALLQTGRDLGLIKVDPESAAANWAEATAAGTTSETKERAGAAAAAATSSPQPHKSSKPTPAHLASKGAASRQSGNSGPQQSGPSTGK